MAKPSSPVSSGEVQAMLDALPDAVLTSDSAGNVEFLNRAAEQLSGHTRETASGRPLGEVLPLGSDVDDTPLESLAIRCLRAGASLGPFEAKLLDGPDPARRVVDVSAAPIRNRAGVVTGTILIARDVTHARQVVQQLSHQATHDALTGLVNRAEFERRVTQALVSAAKEGSKHALGFLDLDGFKRINDACGHLAGDQLLQELSALLRGVMRARDTVARLGGDEFGILLEHCSPAKAVRIAEEIRKNISDHRFTCGGRAFSIGVSIGIVPVHPDGASPTQLIGAADAACYQAKRQGGNRVQLSGVPKKPSSPAQRLIITPATTSEKFSLPGGAQADICAAHTTLSGVNPQSGGPRA
ncbi:MAG: diguanylate cyclase domain-containing protein [Gemmatimonadales bacterium]